MEEDGLQVGWSGFLTVVSDEICKKILEELFF
jgi:hypothetical protein